MSIQFKFFLIPVKSYQEAESELNRFLRSVRALTVNREFVDQGPNSFWCLAIEYLADVTGKPGDKPNRNRIDYKELLSPEDFAVFVKLREWRKQAAAPVLVAGAG